jgi:hypothetical protein
MTVTACESKGGTKFIVRAHATVTTARAVENDGEQARSSDPPLEYRAQAHRDGGIRCISTEINSYIGLEGLGWFEDGLQGHRSSRVLL